MSKRMLFVYGTLKKGYGNNRLLQRPDCRFVAEATTDRPYLLMNFGRFPGMYQEGAKKETPKVRGELWEVSDEAIVRCDYLEGHPTMYRRTPIKVTAHVGLEDKEVDCETYFYQGGIHGIECSSGHWENAFRSR